jgi:glucokinase
VILAGDIGGTNTRLALFEADGGPVRLVGAQDFRNAQYTALKPLVEDFLRDKPGKVKLGCFGVAGPVVERQARMSNLAWALQEEDLAREFAFDRVLLLNDLYACAYGIGQLPESDFVALNPTAVAALGGSKGVVAAGTGLGEAAIVWTGTQYVPLPSEGGHCSFAPNGVLQTELLQWLAEKFGHVSVERVLSGQGLLNIYEFLRDSGKESESPELKAQIASAKDAAAEISRAGLAGSARIAAAAVEIFAQIFGAEAGNLGLKFFATGGVYLGGGIAPKMLAALQKPEFLEAFLAKGRMRELLERIPVSVVMNQYTGLIGAAAYARDAMARRETR